jgi:hypothetical protein
MLDCCILAICVQMQLGQRTTAYYAWALLHIAETLMLCSVSRSLQMVCSTLK